MSTQDFEPKYDTSDSVYTSPRLQELERNYGYHKTEYLKRLSEAQYHMQKMQEIERQIPHKTNKYEHNTHSHDGQN